MHSNKKIDMTRGPIMRLVLLFALPICIGNILQQLYNTVDTLVISNHCGDASIAAIGTSSQPVEMLLCVFLGLGTGVSILVSQYTGSGRTGELKELVATATAFLYICAIPLSVIGIFISPMFLELMKVPPEAKALAVSYLRIIFLGVLGNMGYNFNAGILRGVGDSRSSLLFLLASCIINIVLDLVFVVLCKMDVAGAALATIIAMYSSWFLSILYIKKKHPYLEFSILPKSMNKQLLRNIIAIGLPLGLNNSIYSVGHILMQSLVNLQGTVFAASCAIATKLTGIANVAITSLSSAASTFAGQNLGAGNYKRLKAGGLRIPLTSGLITCTAGLLITFFRYPIIGLFTDDPETLRLGALYIQIVLPSTWCYAVFNGIINYVNGIGEIRYSTIINLLMLWAVRIPVAYFINYFIDGEYITACFPISFSFGMICMLAFFLSKRWKNICSLAAEQTSDSYL